METADEYAAAIAGVMKSREFRKFRDIAPPLFASRQRMQILAALTGRLPGIALVGFLLVNLPHLSRLDDDDYRQWFDASRASGVALYDLTRFFIEHGRVLGPRFRALCRRYPEIAQIEQFHGCGDEVLRIDPGDGKMNIMRYRELQVADQELQEFRRRIARCALFDDASA